MSRLFQIGLSDSNATYFTTPPSSVYDNLRALTVAAWVNPKSTGTNGIGYVIVKDPNVTDSIISDFNDTDGHWYGGAGNGSSITNEIVPFNTWTHIAVTCDYSSSGDGKVRIYFNGVEQTYSAQVVATPLADDSSQGFSFGNFPLPDTDYGWDGKIAEVAVWNKALSATEVAALAASASGASGVATSNLVGYWPLYGIDSPEPDLSGNGNNASASPNVPALDTASPGRYWGTLPDTSHTFSTTVNSLITALQTIAATTKSTLG